MSKDGGAASSSSMISLQRSMHSSQMYTPGPGDQLLDLALGLAAEAAEKLLVGICRPCHFPLSVSPSVLPGPLS